LDASSLPGISISENDHWMLDGLLRAGCHLNLVDRDESPRPQGLNPQFAVLVGPILVSCFSVDEFSSRSGKQIPCNNKRHKT
jgi:hypothetical protein